MSRLKSTLHLWAGLILTLVAQRYSLLSLEEDSSTKFRVLCDGVLYDGPLLMTTWILAGGCKGHVRGKVMATGKSGMTQFLHRPGS